MYVPRAFSVHDRRWVLDQIRRYPFGLLIACQAPDPLTTHLPMYATERDGELSIWGHVARANPQAQAILAGARATAVFSGAHAFVSASWYEEPYDTVPTWNYTAVYTAGALRECDPRPVIDAIALQFEGKDESAWRADRLDKTYLESQMKAIVAFELRVDNLIPKAKLSQNRTSTDRQRVIAKLLQSNDPIARECAQAMKDALREER